MDRTCTEGLTVSNCFAVFESRLACETRKASTFQATGLNVILTWGRRCKPWKREKTKRKWEFLSWRLDIREEWCTKQLTFVWEAYCFREHHVFQKPKVTVWMYTGAWRITWQRNQPITSRVSGFKWRIGWPLFTSCCSYICSLSYGPRASHANWNLSDWVSQRSR